MQKEGEFEFVEFEFVKFEFEFCGSFNMFPSSAQHAWIFSNISVQTGQFGCN